MVQAMLAESEPIEEILGKAVGCTVTREEHQLLSRVDPQLDGWQRYVAAGVRVYDTSSGTPAVSRLGRVSYLLLVFLPPAAMWVALGVTLSDVPAMVVLVAMLMAPLALIGHALVVRRP